MIRHIYPKVNVFRHFSTKIIELIDLLFYNNDGDIMSRKINEDKDLIESFAKNIDKYIVDNHLTNQQFGDLLGIDEATVRKYRKGTVLPSHDQMKKITIILKMHYHDIMGYEDPTQGS